MIAPSSRVLVLLAEWFGDLDGGAKIRAMQMVEALAADHDVRVLCFDETVDAVRTDRIPIGPRQVFVTRVPHRIRIRRRPFRLLAALARSVVVRRPYVVSKFHSRAFARALDEALAGFGPAWIHCGHLGLLPFVAKVDRPVVFDVSDVVHEVWVDYARTRAWPLSACVRAEARRIRRHEHRCWAHAADALVCISHHDADRIAQVASCPVVVIPPAPSPAVRFVPPAPDRTDVGMIGNWTWPPNREGLQRLADELLPLARRRGEPLSVVIAGRGIAGPLRQRLRAEGVEILDRVEDPMEFYARVGIVVAPYQVGCGVRLKVVDAMAAGCALVATPMALRGLPDETRRIAAGPSDGASIIDALAGLRADGTARRARALTAREVLDREHGIARTRALYAGVVGSLRVGRHG